LPFSVFALGERYVGRIVCTLVKSAFGGEEVGKDEGNDSSNDEKLTELMGGVGETILS
jgi:hypothetical protein